MQELIQILPFSDNRIRLIVVSLFFSDHPLTLSRRSPEAARRKIAAPRIVIVSERRSRESNDPDRRSPLMPPASPSPYVHPISPKVTQESAEGRSPKMTKRNGDYRCVLLLEFADKPLEHF